MTRLALLGVCMVCATLLAASGNGNAHTLPQRAAEPQLHQGLSTPITRRGPLRRRSGSDLHAWANRERAHLRNKYNLGDASTSRTTERGLQRRASVQRRAVGATSLTNVDRDASWTAAFQIGTPGQAVNLVLDTGSADIWIDSSDRSSYKPADSTTFKNSSDGFSITYGSGAVKGYLAQDAMQLADQSATAQTFALATDVTRGLLNQAIDGIAGLGFKALSTARATPFWQNVGLSSADQVFSFFLQREIDSNSPENTQYGGVFTLGGTNTSLYQGDLNWSEVIDQSYWLITLGGVTLQNSPISLGSTVNAAIDTGTTLIGGPDSVIAALYAQIPGSSPSADSEGYYNYPCATNVSASVTFGNQAYVLSPSDFLAGATDRTGETCLGAFFSVGSDETKTLQWIVGAAFLKSVYSVFDYNDGKPRVGFAALADGLNGGTESSTVAQTQTAKISNGAAALLRQQGAAGTLVATLLCLTLCIFAVLL